MFGTKRISKKWAVVLAGSTLLVGGVAYGYWATTGSGTGTAATGDIDPIVVNQTSTVTNLAPGLAAVPLSGNFDNPNDGPVRVGAVTATVTGTDVVGCDNTNYVITGTATVGVDVPAGNAKGSWSGLSIQFVNKPTVNQNVCQGANVNIAYSSN